MKYKLLYITLFIALSAKLYSQEFTATVSKNPVATGERFQVTFQLNTSGSGFKAPEMGNFRVLSGPNQSTNMQWINGTMSSSISFSYILMAVEEGEFTIGSASITANGKQLTTEPIKIKVVKGASVQPQNTQPNTGNSQAQQSKGNSETDNNIFIKLFVDKNKVYQGEQLVATYKIYTRLNIINNDISKLPSFNGFWTQDIELPQHTQIGTEVYNGMQYNTAVLKKAILFPQRSGSLEIDALALDVIVRIQEQGNPRSIFDQFFGRYKDVKVNIESNKAKIEVLPLPSNTKPTDFSGAVGKFSLSSSVDKNKVKTNEAINLKITFSGKGNIKLLETLPLKFPADFETYEPKITDKISANESGVSGKREFEYLLIPRHSGNFKIESVSFSFFDPQAKDYVTLQTGEHIIEVEKGANEPETTIYSNTAREDVKMIGKDIRYIKSGPVELKEKDDTFFGSRKFYLFSSVPFICFILLMFARKSISTYNSDEKKIKYRKANKIAHKRLANAKKILHSNEDKPFYEEIFKALYGYLSDKLSIPVAELNKESIVENLKKKNIPEKTISELLDSLNTCEMARFSPVSDISKDKIYANAINIISEIDDNL